MATNMANEEIIRQSKERMHEIMTNLMTPEVKEECPGVVLVLLSQYEYANLRKILNDYIEIIRERKRNNTSQWQNNTTNSALGPKNLVLSVITE